MSQGPGVILWLREVSWDSGRFLGLYGGPRAPRGLLRSGLGVVEVSPQCPLGLMLSPPQGGRCGEIHVPAAGPQTAGRKVTAVGRTGTLLGGGIPAGGDTPLSHTTLLGTPG